MDWVDILRKATLLVIIGFDIISVMTFIYFVKRWRKENFLNKLDYARSLVRLIASIWIGIYCFFTVFLLLGKPLSWECPTIFPLFIILNVSQFMNFSEQWTKYYRKNIHLSDL